MESISLGRQGCQSYVIYETEFRRPWLWQNKQRKRVSDIRNSSRINLTYDRRWGLTSYSITSVQSGLMIEGLYHTVTAPRGSVFHSTGMPLHAARRHWWIVRLVRIVQMIDNSHWAELELFRSTERSFSDIVDSDQNISHYQIEQNLWGHTHKRL